MDIGYVRVSSKDQNEARQVEKMKALGIEDRFVFIDKASGKNIDREAYQAMLLVIRSGDLVYFDSLDRLGRNYDDITQQWKYISRDLGADIVCLDMADLFDTRKFRAQGDIGKLLEDQMLSLLAYVAEQERKKIKSRQREGIEIAKASGRYKGRKPIEVDAVQFDSMMREVLTKERTNKYAMEKLGLKPVTYYRLKKEYLSKHELVGGHTDQLTLVEKEEL